MIQNYDIYNFFQLTLKDGIKNIQRFLSKVIGIFILKQTWPEKSVIHMEKI